MSEDTSTKALQDEIRRRGEWIQAGMARGANLKAQLEAANDAYKELQAELRQVAETLGGPEFTQPAIDMATTLVARLAFLLDAPFLGPAGHESCCYCESGKPTHYQTCIFYEEGQPS